MAQTSNVSAEYLATLHYTGKRGLHRAFPSQTDADLYDWGVGRFPREPEGEDYEGPEWRGFKDAAALEGIAQMRALDTAWAMRRQA